MPVVIVDSEQAELIEAALVMFEAALGARTKRADPNKVISNSLSLQARKLATVRRLLQAPEPPDFSNLSAELAAIARQQIEIMINAESPATLNQAWQRLRGVAIAPGFPQPAET